MHCQVIGKTIFDLWTWNTNLGHSVHKAPCHWSITDKPVKVTRLCWKRKAEKTTIFFLQTCFIISFYLWCGLLFWNGLSSVEKEEGERRKTVWHMERKTPVKGIPLSQHELGRSCYYPLSQFFPRQGDFFALAFFLFILNRVRWHFSTYSNGQEPAFQPRHLSPPYIGRGVHFK